MSIEGNHARHSPPTHPATSIAIWVGRVGDPPISNSKRVMRLHD